MTVFLPLRFLIQALLFCDHFAHFILYGKKGSALWINYLFYMYFLTSIVVNDRNGRVQKVVRKRIYQVFW